MDNLTVVALVAFLAGVVFGVAVVLAAVAYRGGWVALDDPECERDEHPGGCTAPSRSGWRSRKSVRWRAWFRCAGCDAKWVRRYVWWCAPAWLLESMAEFEAESRGSA